MKIKKTKIFSASPNALKFLVAIILLLLLGIISFVVTNNSVAPEDSSADPKLVKCELGYNDPGSDCGLEKTIKATQCSNSGPVKCKAWEKPFVSFNATSCTPATSDLSCTYFCKADVQCKKTICDAKLQSGSKNAPSDINIRSTPSAKDSSNIIGIIKSGKKISFSIIDKCLIGTDDKNSVWVYVNVAEADVTIKNESLDKNKRPDTVGGYVNACTLGLGWNCSTGGSDSDTGGGGNTGGGDNTGGGNTGGGNTGGGGGSTTPTTCNSDPSTTDSQCFNQAVGSNQGGCSCILTSGAGCRCQTATVAPATNTCGEPCNENLGLCVSGYTCTFRENTCAIEVNGTKQQGICVPNNLAELETEYQVALCSNGAGNYLKNSSSSAIDTTDFTTKVCNAGNDETNLCGPCGPMDTDGNGKIDIIDFSYFAQAFTSASCPAEWRSKSCNSYGAMAENNKSKPDIVDFDRFVKSFTSRSVNPTPTVIIKPTPPVEDRDSVPSGAILLQNGTGLSNGAAMSNGNFQVEGFCTQKGYAKTTSNSDHWYCDNPGHYELSVEDYDTICNQTYNKTNAFAIQSGSGGTPAQSWRCYSF